MSQKNKPEDNNQLSNPGNASNPSPDRGAGQPANKNQLLDEQAEKYLRESGNIEDYPDANDMEEAEKEMDKKKKNE